MKQYLDLVRDIYENGEDRVNERTGEVCRSVFGRQQRYNLAEEFPIVKSKFTPFKLIVNELLWFLSGSSNIKYLKDHNNNIWNEWADAEGNLGPVYGVQWRSWKKYSIEGYEDYLTHHEDKSSGATYFKAKVKVSEIDQIQSVIDRIKTNPSDRRLIVSPWNVGELDEMALPPCHCFFQFYVSPSNKLSCQLYQRSNDTFLGVPFNIASYALLTHMVAQVCDLQVGDFIHTMGDAHLYQNHFSQVEMMLSREPIVEKASLVMNPEIKNIDQFKMEDFKLENYVYHPAIKAPVAV